MDGISEGVDQGQGTSYTGDGGQAQGTDANVNPAWQEYLTDVPQDLLPKVTSAFQKWDSGVQKMVEKVHSEYEPWQKLSKAGVSPEVASYAVDVYNALENNPQMVYEALGELVGQLNDNKNSQAPVNNTGQGQQQPAFDQDNVYAQQIQGLQRQNQAMVDYLTAQRQAQLDSEAETQLNRDLEAVKNKFKLDEQRDFPFVVGMMAGQGISAEAAAQQLVAYRDNIAQQYVPKPLIMGSGGGVPGAGLDPRKLDDKQTKDLVVQMLMHNKVQQQQ